MFKKIMLGLGAVVLGSIVYNGYKKYKEDAEWDKIADDVVNGVANRMHQEFARQSMETAERDAQRFQNDMNNINFMNNMM